MTADQKADIELECLEEYEQQTKQNDGEETAFQPGTEQNADPNDAQQMEEGNESDNSSQYEDIDNELEEANTTEQSTKCDSCEEGVHSALERENLLTENLKIPAKMSPQFHRFYENFTK